MTMQKSEFQITGYLYKRSAISPAAWSLRYAILSTDTGAVKLYAEKSGLFWNDEVFYPFLSALEY